ncbi:GMP synthase [Zalerion maritima]|uniref:GMP synthase n=1 Tax=Zalerion maritima TaxID=339359 RepID=A0AAD5S3C8_9PEZI|nr:GMP synthase [Zalerion maritima]
MLGLLLTVSRGAALDITLEERDKDDCGTQRSAVHDWARSLALEVDRIVLRKWLPSVNLSETCDFNDISIHNGKNDKYVRQRTLAGTNSTMNLFVLTIFAVQAFVPGTQAATVLPRTQGEVGLFPGYDMRLHPTWEVDVGEDKPYVVNGTVQEVRRHLAERGWEDKLFVKRSGEDILRLRAEAAGSVPGMDTASRIEEGRGRGRKEDARDVEGGHQNSLETRQRDGDPQYHHFLCWVPGQPTNRDEAVRGVEYLEGLDGSPKIRAKGCDRVSCAHDTAIWWCNDNDHTLVLHSWITLADGARRIVDDCQTNTYTAYDQDVTAGQNFNLGGFNVLIRDDDDHC